MEKLSLDSSVWLVRCDGLVEAPSGDRLLMMSIELGQYYDLNPTAKFVWQALSQPRQIGQICTMMQKHFDVSEAVCTSTVLAFVQQLLAENMVRVTEEAQTDQVEI